MTADWEKGTLGGLVRLQAAARGDAPAFVCQGRVTSYRTFNRRTSQVANGLAREGMQRGDRIAYLGQNSDHYFEILCGAAKAGVVLTPVNWRLAPSEVLYILKDSTARMIFVEVEFIDSIIRLLPELAAMKIMLALGPNPMGRPEYLAWCHAQSDTDLEAPIRPDDVAIQLYTSGTTGKPKGAMLRHSGLLGLRAWRIGASRTWSEADVTLIAMPVFHISGTIAGVWALQNGAKAIIMREFEPGSMLDHIERERVSIFIAVPAAMQILVSHPQAATIDYSSLRYIYYGASPIPVELLRKCMATFGCSFVQMYGMTESSGPIAMLTPEDHLSEDPQRLRSAGRAVKGVEIAVADASGKRLPLGQIGEIITRSVANMAGYWNMQEATRQTIDVTGWLRTGDAGYLDEKGYLFIHDRVKDMIISGGENVYPAEVENAIFGHPAIADVAVIGVPDAKWGESVKALVVRKTGCTLQPQEVIDWARQRIAGYKAPKTVEFLDSLPRNPSGKILRRQLREPYWKEIERNVN